MSGELDPGEVLGDLPASWNAVPSGTLFNFKNGLNYSASQTGTGRGISVIGVGDFANRFRFRPDGNLVRVEVPDSGDKSCLLKPSDILFVRSNGNKELVGRVMFLDRVDTPVSHSGFTIRGRVAVAGIDPLFAAYFFSSALVKQQFLRLGGGTNISNLSQDILKAVVFPRPPLREQHKIADILTTWDRAIESSEKLIAAKRKRKDALMQQLLTGKVRLPGFGGLPVSSDSLIASAPAAVWRGIYPPSVQPGTPKIIFRPSGWEQTTMGQLLQIQKRPIELQEDRVYQLVVAKRNRGGIEPRERLLGREIKTPTQFAVHQGDFVISRRQIIHGACGVVPPSLDGAIVSNEYAVCRVKGKLNIDFLKYLTHTLYFQQTCFHASVGVALEKMIFRLERWLTFPFVIPPLAEQQAIARLLGTADSEIGLHEKKLDALRRQKKGLMQQLLTGRMRVRLDEPPGG